MTNNHTTRCWSNTISATDQRTVNVGQAPIWIDEHDHCILSALGKLSIFGRLICSIYQELARCQRKAYLRR